MMCIHVWTKAVSGALVTAVTQKKVTYRVCVFCGKMKDVRVVRDDTRT